MHIMPKMLWLFGAISLSTMLTNDLSAYCSRCTKIEAARAREQAEHPQKIGYYDDQIELHKNEDRKSNMDSSSSKDSQMTKPANISGSTYPATETEKSPQSQPKGEGNLNLLSKVYQSSPDVQPILLAASYSVADQSSAYGRMNSNRMKPQKSNSSDVNQQEQFFEENEVLKDQESNSSIDKRADTKNTFFKKGEGIPSDALLESSYSALYTIFKTKYFLETLDGSFTLFIPTNDAFRQLPPGALMELTKTENQEKLAALVSNHVVARKMLKQDFETYSNREIKAISGRNLTIRAENGKLSVENAQILRTEPAGYDGVIYVIDKVLIP